MNEAFIKAFGQTSSECFTPTCKDADLILVMGALPSRHDQALVLEIETCVKEGVKLVYLSTMEDAILTPMSTFFSRYEVGSEEGVWALLAKSFLSENMPKAYASYFEALDEGYVSAESNIGEEEIEEIHALYEDAKNVVLILNNDVTVHPRAKNIARFAGLIASFGKAKIFSNMPMLGEESSLEALEDLASFDGIVVYECPAMNHEEESFLIGSAQFQTAAKVQHNDLINVVIDQAVYSRTFVRDDSLKGVIALLPSAKKSETYPYHVAKIMKAEQ